MPIHTPIESQKIKTKLQKIKFLTSFAFVIVKFSLHDYNYDYFRIFFIRLRLRLRNRLCNQGDNRLYNRRDYALFEIFI